MELRLGPGIPGGLSASLLGWGFLSLKLLFRPPNRSLTISPSLCVFSDLYITLPPPPLSINRIWVHIAEAESMGGTKKQWKGFGEMIEQRQRGHRIPSVSAPAKVSIVEDRLRSPSCYLPWRLSWLQLFQSRIGSVFGASVRKGYKEGGEEIGVLGFLREREIKERETGRGERVERLGFRFFLLYFSFVFFFLSFPSILFSLSSFFSFRGIDRT